MSGLTATFILICCGVNPFDESNVDEGFNPAEEVDITDEDPAAEPQVQVDVQPVVVENTADNVQSATPDTSSTTPDDTTAPTVSGLANVASYATQQSFSWSCDETCTYRFVVDQTADSTPTGTFADVTSVTVNTGSGQFFIHVQARDQAGNESTVSHASFLLDNTGPTGSGTINVSAANSNFTSSPTMIWSAFTDSHSGLDYYEVAIVPDNGDSTCNASDFSQSLTLNWTKVPANTDFSGAGWQIVNGNQDADNNNITLALAQVSYCSAVRAVDQLANTGDPVYSATTWRMWLPIDNTSPTVALWYDAGDNSTLFTDTSCSQTVTNTNDKVACWTDKSGDGSPLNATESVSATRPSYIASATNNRSGVRFSGSQSMQIAAANAGALAAFGTGNFELIMVVKMNAIGAAHQVISNWDLTNGLEFGSNASDNTAVNVGDDGVVNSTFTNDGQAHFYIFNRVSSQITLARDKDSSVGATRADSLNSSAITYLGRHAASATQFLDGDILELLIFNGTINMATSQKLAAYLEAKWGVDIF